MSLSSVRRVLHALVMFMLLLTGIRTSFRCPFIYLLTFRSSSLLLHTSKPSPIQYSFVHHVPCHLPMDTFYHFGYIRMPSILLNNTTDEYNCCIWNVTMLFSGYFSFINRVEIDSKYEITSFGDAILNCPNGKTACVCSAVPSKWILLHVYNYTH